MPLCIYLFLAALDHSCGTRDLSLQHVGLIAPQHVGVLVPQPGIEPTSFALEDGFLTTGPPGKSRHVSFLLVYFHLLIDGP